MNSAEGALADAGEDDGFVYWLVGGRCGLKEQG